MPKTRYLAAGCAALLLGACASDPYYYSEPRYVSSGSVSSGYYGNGYYGNGAYSDFGRVVAIDVVRGDGGRTSGGGAVAGAIVGGVLGHQIGSGRGNDLATAAGAIGGAVVGNDLERRRDRDDVYRVVVQFENGREAVFHQDSLHGIRVGDRVRVADNRLYRD